MGLKDILLKGGETKSKVSALQVHVSFDSLESDGGREAGRGLEACSP